MAKMTENFSLAYLDTFAHPVAHALAALAITELLGILTPTTFPLVILAAFAPDLDTVIGLPHRTFTHSLAALSAVALITFAAGPTARATATTIAYASHLVVDLLHGQGIRLLWPARQPYNLAALQPAWIAAVAAAIWLIALARPLGQPAVAPATPTPTLTTIQPAIIITRRPPFPIFIPPTPSPTPTPCPSSPLSPLGGCR